MIVSYVQAGASLLVQAAHPDTVLIRQVGAEHTWLELTATILSIVMSLAMIVLSLALIPAARNFRKDYIRLHALFGRIHDDVQPFFSNAHAITENVRGITTTIRADVLDLHAAVAAVHEQVLHAVSISEQRLQELNALLEVAQQEAESVFVATASTMRGVRTGAASFHHGDDEDEAFDASRSASEELNDGHDSSDAPEAGTAGPRIRPRRREWRGA